MSGTVQYLKVRLSMGSKVAFPYLEAATLRAWAVQVNDAKQWTASTFLSRIKVPWAHTRPASRTSKTSSGLSNPPFCLLVSNHTSPSAHRAPKMNSVASKRLFQEYKHLTTDPPEGITAGPVTEDDLFVWEAMIQGPEGTPYEGGVFPAELKFPRDYPLMPPTMKFLCDIWHPNGMLFLSLCQALVTNPDHITVYPNGNVCISILHAPGDDPNHYEQASERWSPIQSVEKILISVMSMIAEPNDESPANVDAARMWRERRTEFERRVKADVRRSLGL